jgi:hypothetical protein
MRFVRHSAKSEWGLGVVAAAGTLTFADSAQITMDLNSLDPSWGSRGYAVLDAILRSGRGEEVARAI